ncbi:MAG: hypothetical protein IJU70_11135 [Lentisphaeria bacterium]|nr:hypothetical protein [Lentisphaeria bacterium]
MSLWGSDQFAVVMFSPTHIRGAVFSRGKSVPALTAFAEERVDSSDASGCWKTVLNRIGCGKSVPMYICGSFRGGIFFQTLSADLPADEQRGALELELPRHLISIPDDHRLQFVPCGGEGEKVRVNAYVFPAASIGSVADPLSGCGRKTDGFIYPLMALQADDPPFFNAEIEPGFCFSGGQWHPFAGEAVPPAVPEAWGRLFSGVFSLPEGFETVSFLPVLLTARLISSRDYPSLRAGLPVLPDELRPRRIRRQLQVTVVLAVLLVVMLAWSASGSWLANRREYNDLKSQIKSLTAETARIQAVLRRQSRTQKDRSKIVGIKSGEYNVLAFLAAFSSLLPENVSVSNFRLSETGIDIVLASETENLDLARVLKPMSDWKISQLQQRQNRSGNGNMVTLKLVPASSGEALKKGRRR